MLRMFTVALFILTFTTSAFADCITNQCKFVKAIIKYENPRNVTEMERIKIAKAITYASQDSRFLKFGISQLDALFLLTAIAKIESNFYPYAVSPKRAAGVKQIHVPTWKISYREAFDINFNILLGKEILIHYLEKARGSLPLALCFYYGACKDNYPQRVLKKAEFYKSIYRKVFQ